MGSVFVNKFVYVPLDPFSLMFTQPLSIFCFPSLIVLSYHQPEVTTLFVILSLITCGNIPIANEFYVAQYHLSKLIKTVGKVLKHIPIRGAVHLVEH